VVHESTDLMPHHITELDGIPVTVPARTVIDLGASARGLVGGALDTLIRSGTGTLREVLHVLQEVARRGRDGCGIIRPHIGDQIAMSNSTESYLEGLFERGLTEHGIRQPELQVPVLRPDNSLITRLDFAWHGAKLGVAIDGMAHHGSKHRFQLDRSQQNELELLGWMVLRYTWWDVTGAMPRTARQVRTALQQRQEPETA
jgi:very-short-patch-repair endonuclease